MFLSSTWATGVCFVRRVLAVLKLSQLAAICADFWTFGCDLDIALQVFCWW